MLIKGHQLGVQSYCFRTMKTNEEVAQAVKACGLDALELCGVHLNYMDTPAVDAALALYRDNGIMLTSFGVNRYTKNEAETRPLFELARKAGISAMSADPDPDALDLLENLCTEYGIKLAIHNHGRKHRYGKVSELEAIFAKTSPNIGLCLDTAWMLDSGENPVTVAEKFADRLYGVHLKDFTFNRAGRPEDVIVGTGNLDLPALFAVMQKSGFNGYTTLEFEGNADNPVPSVQQCIAQMQQLA